MALLVFRCVLVGLLVNCGRGWRCVSVVVVEGLHVWFVGAYGTCEGLVACMWSSACCFG